MLGLHRRDGAIAMTVKELKTIRNINVAAGSTPPAQQEAAIQILRSLYRSDCMTVTVQTVSCSQI